MKQLYQENNVLDGRLVLLAIGLFVIDSLDIHRCNDIGLLAVYPSRL